MKNNFLHHNYFLFMMLAAIAVGCWPTIVNAENVKLPYAKGELFVVVQGYNSPPTHIKKDFYAIDFSQSSCGAYAKSAVASLSGTVILAENQGYNGGYGTEVLIDAGNNIVNRYAHMISGSLDVEKGQSVRQGTQLGEIGNTGLVSGRACAEHPGTHIHFAEYEKLPNGNYDPVKPEPISTYTNIAQGQWYLSDNDLEDTDNAPPITATIKNVQAFGAESASDSSQSAALPANNEIQSTTIGIENAQTENFQTGSAPIAQNSGTNSTVIENSKSNGGVAVTKSGGGNNPMPLIMVEPTLQDLISGNASDATPAEVSDSLAETMPESTPEATTEPMPESMMELSQAPPPIILFDSSTLSADISWQAPLGAASGTIYEIFDTSADKNSASGTSLIEMGTGTSMTYPVPADGATHNFVIEKIGNDDNPSLVGTTSLETPLWSAVVQPNDSAVSYPSWYDDNWYDLGTGMYGTIRSLTLEGHINNPDYYASHLAIQEFLDTDHTLLNQTFDISDNAPFTATSSKITIGNLNIPLQPTRYYRLTTYQDYQNRSVILAGTNTTGTAQYDSYIVNVGRVNFTSTFSPYLAWTFIPNYPVLAPPNPIANVSTTFSAADLNLNITWPATTDPDTPQSLITYEINIATSSDLAANNWQPLGKATSFNLPVVYNNTYTIGVRAEDDSGNSSPAIMTTWHFPDDYFVLPSQLVHDSVVDGSPEKFVLYSPVTLSAVALWTDPGFGQYRSTEAYALIYADQDGSPGAVIATTSVYYWGHDEWYPFPTPISLSTGTYWIGVGGAPLANNPIIEGTNNNAYFRLQVED